MFTPSLKTSAKVVNAQTNVHSTMVGCWLENKDLYSGTQSFQDLCKNIKSRKALLKIFILNIFLNKFLNICISQYLFSKYLFSKSKHFSPFWRNILFKSRRIGENFFDARATCFPRYLNLYKAGFS